MYVMFVHVPVMKQSQFLDVCCSSGIEQAEMHINFNHGAEIINSKCCASFMCLSVQTDCPTIYSCADTLSPVKLELVMVMLSNHPRSKMDNMYLLSWPINATIKSANIHLQLNPAVDIDAQASVSIYLF